MDRHIYLGFSGWSGDDYNSIARQFEATLGEEPELVYALYRRPAYEGDADIVYCEDGQWFHVSGSHCSCYGLEQQWSPEPFDPEAHLAAAQQGRTLVRMNDDENDFPEATQANFDAWLKEMTAWAHTF